jgi:hypothetical protein
MTKELNCTGCGGPATLTKTVPLCSRCGLAVAEEALGFVFTGLRDGARVIELPAVPAQGMSPKEADDVAHQHLVALRRKGVERMTFGDFRELMGVTGRSRPWVYQWLDDRVKDGDLVKEKTADGVGYTFAY